MRVGRYLQIRIDASDYLAEMALCAAEKEIHTLSISCIGITAGNDITGSM